MFHEPHYIAEWKPKPLRPRSYSSFHGLDEIADEVLSEISGAFGRKRKYKRQKQIASVTIIASLHGCVIEGRPLGISLDANNYKFHPQLHPPWWTYRTLSSVIRLLVEAEFVIKRTGYIDMDTGEGVITKLYASERLLELFDRYAPVGYEWASHQTLVLRNEHKQDIPYKSSSITLERQDFIDRLNRWLGMLVVELDGRRLGTEYIRIFSRGRWDKHGRFYNDLQNLPALERDRITINREKVKDIDYTSMHPRMAYVREGINPVVDTKGDYYAPVLMYLNVAGSTHYTGLRRAVKQMMSIMFNVRDEPEACQAFRDRIRKAKRGEHTDKKAKILEMELAMEAEGFDVDDLISAIEEIHLPISHYFCSDVGVNLMYEDSCIMTTILECCMAEGIPALPIHDSILVQERNADRSEQIMEQAFTEYYAQNGGSAPCA